jgi:hypothetical protein
VGVRIMTWRYLEEEKFFLSASSFNLHISFSNLCFMDEDALTKNRKKRFLPE